MPWPGTVSATEEGEIQEGIRVNIRSYSWDRAETNPDDQLAKSLHTVMESKPEEFGGQWSRDEEPLYPEDLDIESQYVALYKQWSEFREKIEEQQSKVRVREVKRDHRKAGFRRLIGRDCAEPDARKAIEDSASPASFQTRKETAEPDVYTFDDIKNVVFDTQQQWKGKDRMLNGKVQKGFHKVCETLSSHSSMFDMLPNQNQYCSIFCGSIKTLIKASANHIKIAEGLSEFLAETGVQTRLCAEAVRLWPRPNMVQFISQFYSHVFHFLLCAMKWYQKRSIERTLDALNESFFEDFRSQLVLIKEWTGKLIQRGTLYSQAQIKDLWEHEKKKAEREKEERLAERQKTQLIIERMATMGCRCEELLTSLSQAWRFEIESGTRQAKSARSFALRRDRKIADQTNAQSQKRGRLLKSQALCSKHELQLWSRNLQKFTTDIFDHLHSNEFDAVYADKNVLLGLRDWSCATTSQVLWVNGFYERTYPSSTSRLAMKTVAMAVDLQIPILYFFCRSFSNDDEGYHDVLNKEKHEDELVIDFLYSLIRQMVTLLPKKVMVPRKLHKAAFAELDGSLGTWEQGLRILELLIECGPRSLLVVVDGIEQLDDSEVEEYVDDILALLERKVGTEVEERQKEAKLFKVLCTTAGPCSALDKLDQGKLNVVTVDGRLGRHAPGKNRPGRGKVDLSFEELLDDSE